MENHKIPSIRFKGFSDAWEQRKLGDVVARITRKNDKLESTLPLTISAEYGLVDQITFFNNRVASQNILNYYLLYRGDFAYNKSTSDSAIWGAVKRLDGYEKGVLSTLYIVFRPIKVDSEYLVHYYETTNWHPEMAKIASEGARNHGLLNISPDDFFNSQIVFPRSNIEQQLLGVLFQKINSLITLHQREELDIELPSNSQFDEFLNSWEQRKLGDIATIQKGQQINKAVLFDEGRYYVLNGGMTPSGYTDSFNTKANTISISEGGNSCGFVAFNSENFWSGGHNYTLSNLKLEMQFLYQYLKFQEHFIMSMRVGSGLPNMQKSNLEEVKISYPSLGQQKKIAFLLYCIDQSITLHQRECFSIVLRVTS